MVRLILPDGSDYELTQDAPTTLGASADATVRLAGSDVSDMHCVIRALKDGGYGIKDLGSTAGTMVNGRSIRAVRLRGGDEIAIGATKLQFEDASVPPPPPEPEPTPTPAAAPPPPPEPAPDSAGAGASDGEELTEGTWLGGYEIKGVVGHGGMGTVYQATQLSLHRDVALKVLKRELSEDPDFVKRFVSEARAAGRFNHPNVVQVFDVIEEGGRPFYSMELLPGGSLEDRIREHGALSLDEAVSAIDDAARGLAYADELGLVHRDIKPDNLMPTAQGVVKICDLGLATDPSSGTKGKILGTPHFISPEQARNETVDHRSDLYSLGCTFYRLLTGRNPYHRKTVREILRAHLEDEIPRLRDVLPSAPEEIEGVVTRLMAKDPDERYQHASELVADLEAWSESNKQGRKLPIAVLGVLVLGLAAGIGYLLWRGPDEIVKVIPGDNTTNKKTAAQMKELAADNALLSINAKTSLAPLDRAQALEDMAKAHPGTKAAGKATIAAKKLRDAETRRVAAARKERARLEALAKRVGSEAARLLAEGKPVAAWQRARELAGTEPPKVVNDALDAARRSVVTAVTQKADGAFAALEKSLGEAGSDVDAAKAAFEQTVQLDGELPADARSHVQSVVERGNQLITTTANARATEARARLAQLASQRQGLLIGPKGAFALIRGRKLDAANRVLDSVKPPDEFRTAWAPIERTRRWLAAAEAGLKRLQTSVASNTPPTVTYLGSDYTVTALADGVVTLRDAKKQEQQVNLWESPDLVFDLFATKSSDPGDRASRVAVIVTATFANGLPRALEFLRTMGSEAAVEPSFPWTVMPELTNPAGLPKDMGEEMAALAHLGKLLRAWQQGADEAATFHADSLENRYPNSIVAVALGIRGKAASENGK